MRPSTNPGRATFSYATGQGKRNLVTWVVISDFFGVDPSQPKLLISTDNSDKGRMTESMMRYAQSNRGLVLNDKN